MRTDRVRSSDLTAARVTPLPGVRRGDLVLERTAVDLAARFAGIFGVETVRRFVFQCHTELARSARITAHLPALTGRFAADRLRALAQPDGGWIAAAVPEVLFVCTADTGRSQLAATLLTRYAAGLVHVSCAGSAPTGRVDRVGADVLTGRGIPVAGTFSEPLTDEMVRAVYVVVTLGCGDACPVYPGKRYLDWPLPPLAGRHPAENGALIEDMDRWVRALLHATSPRRPTGHNGDR